MGLEATVVEQMTVEQQADGGDSCAKGVMRRLAAYWPCSFASHK